MVRFDYAAAVRYFPFPRERVWLDTQLIPSEVIRKLTEATEPHRWLRWPLRDTPGKQFSGEMKGDRFTVTFIRESEELTSPVMFGEVGPGPVGTRIRLTIRPRLSTLAGVALFWCAGVGFTAVHWGDWRTILGITAFFLVLPYVVCLFKFRRGRQVGREQLVMLLGCRDEPATRLMTRE